MASPLAALLPSEDVQSFEQTVVGNRSTRSRDKSKQHGKAQSESEKEEEEKGGESESEEVPTKRKVCFIIRSC